MQDVLEHLGCDQTLKNSFGINVDQFPFEPLVHPAPPLGIRDVHELRADRAAVEAASKRAPLPGRVKDSNRSRSEAAERIQVRAMEIGALVPLGEYIAYVAARKSVNGFVPARGGLVLWNLEKN